MSHSFHHLFYYPALAGLAVLFTSFRLNMAWVTIVSLVYVAVSLTVEDGIDIEAGDEKALLARITVMYAVVAAVNLATRLERIRWKQGRRAAGRASCRGTLRLHGRRNCDLRDTA